jgi:NADH dehydrogenase (ubiquinone) Fe-S protein 1
LGETLPYDTLQQVRGRLAEVSPNLTRYGLVEGANFFTESAAIDKARAKATAGRKIDVSLKVLEDFYMTDSISKASPTMAKCVQAVKQQKTQSYLQS